MSEPKRMLEPLEQLMRTIEARIDENEADPNFQRREAARAKRVQTAERERLLALAEAAKTGAFGLVGKELWNTITAEGKDTRDGALQELAKGLRGKPRVK